MSQQMPATVFRRELCRLCGAATLDQAESRCRVSQDQTGEYNCLGGCDEDAEGFLGYPTPESIAAIDAWIDAERPATAQPHRLADPINTEGK